jgi:hypothetical protein
MRWFFLFLALLWSLPSQAQEWTSAPPSPIEGPALPVVPADWTTVPGTFLRVHGPEEQTEVLLRIARHGSTALPELASKLEVPIGSTIHVYLADSAEQFRLLQPGMPPTWADATAWPKLGAVFLRAPDLRPGTEEPLEQVLEHELVHVLLGRAFGEQRPPSWLQEGVAQLLAGQIGPEEAQVLQDGATFQGLLALSTLERGFPVDHRKANLAYAQSADFVSWLEGKYGPDTLPTLIRRSAAGDSMRQAVFAATGHMLDEVETEWRSQFRGVAGVRLAAFATQDLLWLVGAVALVGAAVARRRRFHKRLAVMEAEEALVDAWIEAMAQRRAAHG